MKPRIEQIHIRALEISARYKQTQAELIDILQQAEEYRIYLKRGHSSLFRYVVDELRLSESVAYGLITIARKARQVPELKKQLETGAITFSNAQRIASVLTTANRKEWIQKARNMTQRQLEREITKVRPQEATRERASYVAPDRVKLELGLSESAMLRLRRVQDILSQNEKRPVSLEETIQRLSSEFLRKHDPVEKAKRDYVKSAPQASRASNASITSQAIPIDTAPSKAVTSKTVSVRKLCVRRVPIPARILHRVNLRDQRRCAQILPNGNRCSQSRWIEVHHKIPVSAGGTNSTENLITLCSAHHRTKHSGPGKGGPPDQV